MADISVIKMPDNTSYNLKDTAARQDIERLNNTKAPIIYEEKSGNPVQFERTVEEPLKSLKVNFSPVQASGTPSPSNVLPITGWNGITLYRTGVNMIPRLTKGIGFDTTNGSPVTESSTNAGTDFISFSFANDPTLYWSGLSPNLFSSCGAYNAQKQFLGRTDGSMKSSQKITKSSFSYGTAQATGEIAYLRFQQKVPNDSAYTIDDIDNYNIMLNLGSSAESYEPYTGDSYSVIFPALGTNLIDDSKRWLPGSGEIFIGATSTSYTIPIKAGTYTFTAELSKNATVYMRASGASSSFFSAMMTPQDNSVVVIIPNDCIFRINFYASGLQSDDVGRCWLNAGETAKSYEPYTNTVYSGSLNMATGVLTVVWVGRTFNSFDDILRYTDVTNGRFRINIDGIKQYSASLSTPFYCSCFLPITDGRTTSECPNYSVYGIANSRAIYVHAFDCNDVNAFKTTYGNQFLYYELAEPQVIQLTPVQIATLIGTNVIWSNTNEQLTIDYPVDTKIYIDSNERTTDVQINGTSIVSNNIADIPLADTSTYGVVKIGSGKGLSLADNALSINYATSSDIKSGSNTYKAITPNYSGYAAFYGLARAAGDSTQASSNNTVGTYTDDAKGAIQKMLGISSLIAPEENDLTADKTYSIGDIFTANGKLYKATTVINQNAIIIPTTNCEETTVSNYFIHDVQLNGTSAVSSGIVSIPKASYSAFGVIKTDTDYGTQVLSSGHLALVPASSANIKAGSSYKTSMYRAITPYNQHEAVFYGLTKIAGVDMASSANTAGTYTDEAKAAINTMIGSISKANLENAGITGYTYTTKFGGEFTVTTALEADAINPAARSSVTGRIYKEYAHRVTVNGTQYVLPTRLWFYEDKTYEYLGNLNLFVSDISGVPGGTDNVSFVIISDLDDNNSIDVFTSEAGTYTIKVEQITNIQVKLPNSLIYGDNNAPILKHNLIGSTYNGFSIGVNELKNKRGTLAMGYGNSISGEFSVAIGSLNTITSYHAVTLGYASNISGNFSVALGNGNTVSGLSSVALNVNNNVSGNYSVAFGAINNVSGFYATSFGYNNIVNHAGQFAFGVFNVADSATGSSDSPGTYVEIVGNGESNNIRSNARTLDWNGNERLKGNIYVNCNADSTGGTMLPTDVQVNGTSVVNNGVANIPMASYDTFGAVKPLSDFGVAVYNSGRLYTVKATDANVKAGTETYKVIVPENQHKSVFYGLAKAAGDASQASSSNAVGTYTDTAKTAIQTMLGVEKGITLIETITGTTPSITAQPNVRYNCGEVITINITPPINGTCDIFFTSGSTASVLTIPNTVKFPSWFDATALDSNTIYEIMVTDGVYGSVMTWES